MMRKAYLVIRLDAQPDGSRKVTAAGIHGGSWMTLTLKHGADHCFADALVADGDTFEKACDALIATINALPEWRWVKELLKDKLS